MPSTCSCVLSLVMQIWLGTSKGISRRSWRYATRSTKGMTKFKPGARTAWNRPRRSTTSACCCGTTLIAWMTTMTATMKSASVTIDEPIMATDSKLVALGAVLTAVRENQHRAARGDDVHGFRLRSAGRKLGVPGTAAIGDPRSASRAPGLDADPLTDVEIGLHRRCRGNAALPALQHHGADDAQGARGQPLHRNVRS